jgi:hypothetical protein
LRGKIAAFRAFDEVLQGNFPMHRGESGLVLSASEKATSRRLGSG